MKFNRSHLLGAGLLAAALLLAGPGAAGEKKASAPPPDGLVLLENGSFWRYHVTWGTELCRMEDGKLVSIHPAKTSERYRKQVDGRNRYLWRMKLHPGHRAVPLPPDDWRKPEFNDSEWQRRRGPFAHGPTGSSKRGYKSTPLVCLRGKFQVENLAGVGELTLSVSYLGGIVVYVNGKEVGRGHMPKGEIKPTTPAEDYPLGAFFDGDGRMWDQPEVKSRKEWRAFEKKMEKGRIWDGSPEAKNPEALAAFVSRLRRASVKIPASALKKGLNVLAIENHRPPAPDKFFTANKSKKYVNQQHLKSFCWWSRVGLTDVRLIAKTGAAAKPNAGHAGRPAGFHVWTHPIIEKVYTNEYPDPSEPLQPVKICSPRNGAHSGQILVLSEAAITGFKVEASDLSGPGKIPAKAVQIRYAQPDGSTRKSSRPPWFDSLEEVAPTEVPVRSGGRSGKKCGALQPVWLTVRVPKEAKAGLYKGTVTVSASGQKAVKVPLEVEVTDWLMPDSKEFFAHMGLIQSPESVALQYKVPMWSKKHWELLERTFKLLGGLSSKVIYITAQYKTHFGNDQSMIRYVKTGKGKYKPDFTIARKYLDLAVKYQGKVPVVGLYIWRSPWVTGNFDGAGPRGDRKILISLVDKEGGEITGTAEGPAWGTPEVREFWKPVVDGMKKLCAERGIEKSLMIGMSGDYTPTDIALADLEAVTGGLKWIHHSHVVRNVLGNMGSVPTGPRKWERGKGGKTYAVGYIAAAWGGFARRKDPDFGRGYGWKNPMPRVETRTPPRGRMHMEQNITAVATKTIKGAPPDAGLHGLGRTGADFWKVLVDGRGRKVGVLAGRYTETRWGQLGIRCCGLALLAPGKEGAIATYRSEMVRENVQEVEARVFIEKALHDEGKKAKIGEELAKRALEVLDERVRASQRQALCSEIAKLGRDLYRVVAEVAKKLEE